MQFFCFPIVRWKCYDFFFVAFHRGKSTINSLSRKRDQEREGGGNAAFNCHLGTFQNFLLAIFGLKIG